MTWASRLRMRYRLHAFSLRWANDLFSLAQRLPQEIAVKAQSRCATLLRVELRRNDVVLTEDTREGHPVVGLAHYPAAVFGVRIVAVYEIEVRAGLDAG